MGLKSERYIASRAYTFQGLRLRVLKRERYIAKDRNLENKYPQTYGIF